MTATASGSLEGGAPEDPLLRWYDALEQRALADLRFSDVRRALQALSSIYVERRDRIGAKAALDGAGKRAAFALFYGPIHFLTVRGIARQLLPGSRPNERVLDLGCGTGASGAAWTLEERRHRGGPGPRVEGVDESAWAVEETTFTYRTLGVPGRARQGALERVELPGAGSLVIVAWTLNELDRALVGRMLERLFGAVASGASVLVVEPLARGASPFWPGLEEHALRAGGRTDEWRFPADLPPRLRLLDKAAGLDHQTLGARSAWIPGAGPASPGDVG